MRRVSAGFGVVLALAVAGCTSPSTSKEPSAVSAEPVDVVTPVRAPGTDPAVPAAWPVAEGRAYLLPLEPIAADTRRIVAELGATNYATRERATKELKEKGTAAFPGLAQLVVQSDDAEITTRTAGILIVRYLLSPNTPRAVEKVVRQAEQDAPRMKENVKRMKNPDDPVPRDGVLESSLNGMHSDEAALTCEILLGQEKDPVVRRVIESTADNVAGARARMAIVEGNWDEAERLLRAAAGRIDKNRNDLAALVALRRGDAFDPQKELDAIAPAMQNVPKGAAIRRDEMGYLLFRAKGNLARAGDWAKNFSEPYGPDDFPGLVEAQRYDDLIGALTMDPKKDRDPAGHAIALMVMGKMPERDVLAASFLVKAPKAPVTNGRLVQYYDLLRCDHAEDVIGLAKGNPVTLPVAFELLCRQDRLREALALMPDRATPPTALLHILIDTGFSSEARRLMAGMNMRRNDAGKNIAGYESDLAAAWDRLGDAKQAEEWREKAFGEIADPDAKLAALDAEERKYRASTDLTGKSTTPQLTNFANRRAVLTRDSGQLLIFTHDPVVGIGDRQTVFNYWMNNYKAVAGAPAMTSRERYRYIKDILAAKKPPEELHKLAIFPPSGNAISWDSAIIGTLHALKRDDLAQDLIEKFSKQTNDPTALATLGHWALQRNVPQEALRWYRQAALMNLTDASLMYGMGVALARQKVTQVSGRELMAFAPNLVLGDHAQALRLEQVMAICDGPAAAEAWLDGYMDRHEFYYYFTDLAVGHATREMAAAEAKGDYSAMLRQAEGRLFFLENTPVLTSATCAEYMADVGAYQRARALDAWARKDAKGLGDALWREMDNGPPDVATMEKVWAVLKAGDAGQEKKVADRALRRLREVVELEPGSVEFKKDLERVEKLGN